MSAKRLTKENFIKRSKAIAKHKGKNYSYEKVDYKGAHEIVIITCSEHGDFEQEANSHLRGSGCPDCSGNKKLDTATFIKKAKIKHKDNNYSYEKVDYKTSHQKVTITCPKHGSFKQTPSAHLSGHGCSDCKKVNISNARRADAPTFIKKAKVKHKGKKYSYEKVVYKGSKINVTIICPKHGDFDQAPSNHLSGKGCPVCGAKERANTKRSDTSTFIKTVKIKHKRKKYSYKKTVYGQNAYEKVTIICPKHGEFQQSPHDHLNGRGCPTCKNKTQAEITEKLISHFPNYDFITGLRPKFLDGMEYDISITLSNGIGVAIEYDGRQHYEPVRFGGMSIKKAEANLKTQKVRDRKKNELSKANGIYLFRIPYYEYDDKIEDKHEDILYEIITQIEELEEYGYEMMEDVR